MAAAPLTALCLALSLGCAPGSGPTGGQSQSPSTTPAHDPDGVPITKADVDMPADYAVAMPRINEYRDKIRTAIEAGTPSKAHRPLDELDIVLDNLCEIARDSGVPKEQWEEVNTASRELRDLFNTLHASIDAGDPPDEETIARLMVVTAEPVDGVERTPDDAEAPEEQP
jgi:hypothetical protein